MPWSQNTMNGGKPFRATWPVSALLMIAWGSSWRDWTKARTAIIRSSFFGRTHGFHLGEKEHWHKYTLWEEATRVPLIVVAPGVTSSGQRCGKPVSLIDLYPTLNELCGLPRRQGLEGTSLVPLLKNPKRSWPRPALITHGRNNHAVRDERWRYIRYHDGSEELYDHQNDPHEWTNLAGRAEFAEIQTGLRTWLPKTNAKESYSTRKKWKTALNNDQKPLPGTQGEVV